mmetsp:Transcript_33628/g.49433  ORF Transcript_33628/g.49433 Transcript_33628/m.49433 type:complete len:243 (+) Transcript_33628:3-731(+)
MDEPTTSLDEINEVDSKEHTMGRSGGMEQSRAYSSIDDFGNNYRQANRTSTSEDHTPPPPSEEIMQQYRLEAQIAAARMCERNTGYNPSQASQKRTSIPIEKENDSKQRAPFEGPKPKQPFIDMPEFKEAEMPKPKLVNRRVPRPTGPELFVGVLTSSLSHSNGAEEQKEGYNGVESVAAAFSSGADSGSDNGLGEYHIVQCLGCQEGLRVVKSASLVSCPNCSTVSLSSKRAASLRALLCR